MIFLNILPVASMLIFGIVATPLEAVYLAKRVQNVLIGYRTVAAAQAREYIAAKTLTYRSNIFGTQIGKGVYTTAELGGWKGSPTDWHCAIFADLEALNTVPKAWVPEKYWFKKEAEVDGFIKSLGGDLDPASTLRMSLIEGAEGGILQMAIPPALLNQNRGGLGISVLCDGEQAALPSASVEYEKWEKVKGDVQKVEKAEGAKAAQGTGAAAESLYGDEDLLAALKQGQVSEGVLFAHGAEAVEIGEAVEAEAFAAAKALELELGAGEVLEGSAAITGELFELLLV